MKWSGAACKVLVLLFFVEAAVAARKWNDLRIRFSILKSYGFHEVPTSTSHSLMENFVKVDPEEGFALPLDFYCRPNDPRACLMFDKKGNVAGVQTSFLKADMDKVDPAFYNYATNTNFKHTNFFNIPAYSFRAFFVNPETLTDAGRTNTEETADGLWVYLDGELIEVPREQPKEDVYKGLYKQNCLRSMGLHYFYKTDKNLTDCSKSCAFFALYEKESLVGYGLATYGEGTQGEDTWYEHPPKLAVKVISPNRPPCMDTYIDKFGLTSMHVYLVDEPWNIACNFFDEVINVATDWLPFRK